MTTLLLYLIFASHKFPLKFDAKHAQTDTGTHLRYIPVTQVRPFTFGVLQLDGETLTTDELLMCETRHEETKAYIENRDGSKSEVTINVLQWLCEKNGKKLTFQVLGIEDPDN